MRSNRYPTTLLETLDALELHLEKNDATWSKLETKQREMSDDLLMLKQRGVNMPPETANLNVASGWQLQQISSSLSDYVHL